MEDKGGRRYTAARLCLAAATRCGRTWIEREGDESQRDESLNAGHAEETRDCAYEHVPHRSRRHIRLCAPSMLRDKGYSCLSPTKRLLDEERTLLANFATYESDTEPNEIGHNVIVAIGGNPDIATHSTNS